MKIIAVGASPPEQRKIADFCQEIGCGVSFTPHIGRPRGNYPRQNVLAAFESENSVYRAAKLAGVSSGTAHRILKDAGLLPKKD